MPLHWPDLPTLGLLVAIADEGSISAGARATGLAQPNASRLVTAYERSLGVQLLDRGPRGAALTRQGTTVVLWARELLEQARVFQRSAAALAACDPASIELAASMTVAEHLLPRWLASFDTPGTAVSVRVHNSADVMARVRSGTYALGFVETPEVDPELASAVVAQDRLVVVVSPDHPWAHRAEAVSPPELAARGLIVREPGSGTRLTLDRVLPRAAAPVLEAGSNSAVLASAALGTAPAVLSELAAAPWLERGLLVAVPVRDLPLTRHIRAVWHGRLTPAARAFLLHVRAVRDSTLARG